MTRLNPYGYQEECLTVLREERTEGKGKALVAMASGLGKTVVAAFDVNSFLAERGGRVLSLCHQNDISDQSYDTFQEVLGEGYSFGYLDGRKKEFEPVDVLFASFQTMRNWREEFPPDAFDYIVVDESHHSPAETYLPTLEYFQPRFMLGITATPDRADLQDIREIYGDEVYSLPLEDGLAQGLLAPVDYRMVTDELQNLKVLDTPIGKLSIAKLNRELFIPKRDDEIARIIQEKIAEIAYPRVMIFAASIAYCDRLANILPDSSPIHSEMPLNEQAVTLRKFRAREINTVITVDKFNEGIDVPDANVIVFLRSTASRTIFFQQLGRGLRKTKGKRQVLVLDFVANCERLEMVHVLRASVMEKKEELERQIPEGEEPIVVDFGKFEFTEEERKVLDVIKGIRTGYTKEILIKYLRKLASELDRTPSRKDIGRLSKLGKSPALKTFRDSFGSYTASVLAAGLEPNWRSFTDEELIRDLKEFTDDFGETPRRVDFLRAYKQKGYASVWTYEDRFGSFPDALKKAGITEPVETEKALKKVSLTTSVKTRVTRRGPLIKTEGELRDDLRSLAKELDRTPKRSDVDLASKQGKCASVSQYRACFGSFTESLIKADLPPNRMIKTNEELLEDLRIYAKELGHTPSKREVARASKQGKIASPNTYRRHFGSYNEAVKKAGLKPNR